MLDRHLRGRVLDCHPQLYRQRRSSLFLVRRATSASLIGRLRSSVFRLSTAAVSMSLTGSRFSSESAPRPFHHGIRDEAEQSNARPCRQTNGRSKGPCELTSSIVPRGTSFHRMVELECPPIRSDLARLSSRAAWRSASPRP